MDGRTTKYARIDGMGWGGREGNEMNQSQNDTQKED